MKKFLSITFILGLVLFFLASCEQKKQKPPFKLDNKNTEIISIPFDEEGGVKTIPVKLNGVPMNMIYDTGCSGISLSLTEVQTMIKNGKLVQSDFLGSSYSVIANGEVVEDALIYIKEIEIGGKDGIVLHNKKANVSLNQVAPVLLGNAVMDELASVEVDNVNKTINFIKK